MILMSINKILKYKQQHGIKMLIKRFFGIKAHSSKIIVNEMDIAANITRINLAKSDLSNQETKDINKLRFYMCPRLTQTRVTLITNQINSGNISELVNLMSIARKYHASLRIFTIMEKVDMAVFNQLLLAKQIKPDIPVSFYNFENTRQIEIASNDYFIISDCVDGYNYLHMLLKAQLVDLMSENIV